MAYTLTITDQQDIETSQWYSFTEAINELYRLTTAHNLKVISQLKGSDVPNKEDITIQNSSEWLKIAQDKVNGVPDTDKPYGVKLIDRHGCEWQYSIEWAD